MLIAFKFLNKDVRFVAMLFFQEKLKLLQNTLLNLKKDLTLKDEKIKELEQTMANMINGISKALKNSGTDYLNKLDL